MTHCYHHLQIYLQRWCYYNPLLIFHYLLRSHHNPLVIFHQLLRIGGSSIDHDIPPIVDEAVDLDTQSIVEESIDLVVQPIVEEPIEITKIVTFSNNNFEHQGNDDEILNIIVKLLQWYQ